MSVLVIPEFENDDEQFLEVEEAVAQHVPDERANIPVSETTERFLRAVLVKVPLDRIEELHLFSPLRQGTAETGIAVIAARVLVADDPEASALELQLEAGPDVEVDEEVDVEVDAAVDVEVDAEVDSHVDAEVEVEVDADDHIHTDTPAHTDFDASVDSEVDTDVVVDAETDTEHDDSPYADDPLPVAEDDALDLVHELAPDVADELPVEPPAPRVRHTVYTARYRLVIKGPDRGKWEMDVVDEADAPLVAVETVVRGVQRRAGEETATVRYDAAQLARVLRINS